MSNYTLRRLAFIAIFAVAHTVATIFVLISAMGAVMLGFDDPSLVTSPVVEKILVALTAVLFFPLGTILWVVRLTIPDWLGIPLLLANGALWAVTLLWAARRIRSGARRRTASPHTAP